MNVKRFSKSRKSPSKSKAHRRRGVRRARMPNPRAIAPIKNNFARSVESVVYEDLMPNTGYINLVNLNDFPRSSALAQYYQFYRITEVKYTYEPFDNVFSNQSTLLTTIPQMYSIMDRSGFYNSPTPFSLETILEQGAKPRKFTSNKVIKYKPNTLVQSQVEGSDGTLLTASPELKWNSWLATQTVSTPVPPPNGGGGIPYYGHIVWFDQNTALTGKPIGRLTLQVVVEFKNPLSTDYKTPSGIPLVKPTISTS